MTKKIKLFMWPYQHVARIEIRLLAERALKALGIDIKPKSLLVGIRSPEVQTGHLVCIEPEDDEWNPCFFFEMCRNCTKQLC